MHSAFRISEAAGLAMHAVTILVRQADEQPLKISEIAKQIGASENHLGKIMHRLAQSKVVLSRRGPAGGFILDPGAESLTFLDLYEMFDGPLDSADCMMGLETCPFGDCVLGDTLNLATRALKESLSKQQIGSLRNS